MNNRKMVLEIRINMSYISISILLLVGIAFILNAELEKGQEKFLALSSQKVALSSIEAKDSIAGITSQPRVFPF